MGEYSRSEYTQYDNFNDKLNWKTITRDLLIFVAIIVVFMSLTPRQKEAPPVNDKAETVQYIDGSTKITQIVLDNTVAAGTSTGTKQYVMFDTISSEFGTTRWEFNITGTFAEHNGAFTCVYSNGEFTSYNTTFYEKDLDITVDGNVINCKLVVGKRFFYIPTSEMEFEFSLTCNPDGSFT